MSRGADGLTGSVLRFAKVAIGANGLSTDRIQARPAMVGFFYS